MAAHDRSNEQPTRRAGAVILASASLCPADAALPWASLGGQPLLAWALAACCAVPMLDPILLVVAEDHLLAAQEFLATAHAATTRRIVPVVASVADRPAGERRRDAIRSGLDALAALAPERRWVVIHTATQPLASAALILAGLAAAEHANAAAIATEPVKETLKRAPGGLGGLVAETLPRAELARAQTPQVYRVADLLAALHALPPAADPPDAVSIAAAARLPLVAYPGGHDNLTVASRADLPILASLLTPKPAAQ